jgi:hypothetical protein
VRSEDDAGVIDRPCPRLPLRGKLVAYAPSVHSETKLDCIYVILRILRILRRMGSLGFLTTSTHLRTTHHVTYPPATLPTPAPISGLGPCPSLLPLSLGPYHHVGRDRHLAGYRPANCTFANFISVAVYSYI